VRPEISLLCKIIIAMVILNFPHRSRGTELQLVDFQRDIAPVLVARCVKCHGPDDAKNDFRVDDKDSVLGLIEPGDLAASSLWSDYLRAEDTDMQMPPTAHGGPLSASELALISVWINEGAAWPDGSIISSTAAPVVTSPNPTITRPTSLVGRVWAFQGYLHPATVHFPIALLTVGGLFVIVGLKYPSWATNVALVCLFLGTVSSVVATMMGWSFAETRGFGSWDRIDTDSEIFWHRWSAVIVMLSSLGTSVLAFLSLRGHEERLGKYWRIGLLLIAGMVGAVGHQGGELTYGKALYKDAFDVLLGTASPTTDGEINPTKPSPSG